ncbi:MAG: aspartyl-tRNA(Asn)/glutamyl-tRNA(Gln) amidotransferase subunit [Patescibacteria group bacterium]|nr:aspartyl-tRNA(Asn)/glutamyl-tRNA(Gln) amidotransferase subunit [Patescibacteria group bacterium]
MISSEEIKNIAKLSHLEIKDDEMEEMRKNFSSILEYVKKLQELNTDDIEATPSIIELESVMREDIAKDNNGDLISSFSRSKNNYLEVKKILYNED